MRIKKKKKKKNANENERKGKAIENYEKKNGTSSKIIVDQREDARVSVVALFYLKVLVASERKSVSCCTNEKTQSILFSFFLRPAREALVASAIQHF